MPIHMVTELIQEYMYQNCHNPKTRQQKKREKT